MALLQRAIAHDDANLERMRSYVFGVNDVFRSIHEPMISQSYEVNLIRGGMYWRRLTENGQPLNAELAAAEQTRLRAHLRTASSQTQAKWREERDVLSRWVAAHRFRTTGRKRIEGRDAILVETKPGGEYAGDLAYLATAHGKLAIDQETGHWLSAEFEIYGHTRYAMFQLLYGRLSLPYSVGLINRANLPSRAKLSFGLRLTADGLWVPRFQLIEAKEYRSTLTFSEFRRFTSESQLLLDPA